MAHATPTHRGRTSTVEVISVSIQFNEDARLVLRRLCANNSLRVFQ